MGTILGLLIDGNYTVEPGGTVPLGPAYGRVNIKGLTLEEAEAAVAKHLRETLQQPNVSVTLAGWKSDEQLKADAEAAMAKRDHQLKKRRQRRKAKKDKEQAPAKAKGESPAGQGQKHAGKLGLRDGQCGPADDEETESSSGKRSTNW